MANETRTILVTGATGGIGTAVCRQLAHSGHSLVLAARNEAKLESLSHELAGTGDRPVWLPLDMTSDQSIRQFGEQLTSRDIVLDGVVLMPPQAHSTNDPMPTGEAWRALFQNCFIGPLEVLKTAIGRMNPDPVNGRRAKIVIISGISSAQVLGHYATSNVLRCAWIGEAKTLAFALGARGIHVNTLSLGGTLSPWYREAIKNTGRCRRRDVRTASCRGNSKRTLGKIWRTGRGRHRRRRPLVALLRPYERAQHHARRRFHTLVLRAAAGIFSPPESARENEMPSPAVCRQGHLLIVLAAKT